MRCGSILRGATTGTILNNEVGGLSEWIEETLCRSARQTLARRAIDGDPLAQGEK